MLGVGEAVEDEVEDGIEEQEDVTVGWGGAGRIVAGLWAGGPMGPVGLWGRGPMGLWAYGAVGLRGQGMGCWGVGVGGRL